MDKQEINNAISEHALYKYRLNELIVTGKLESPKGPCTEHDCAFGKWFYGSEIPPRHRASAYYQRVKELHAEFHKVACNVAHMAIDGDRDGAQRMMEIDGDFSLVSNRMMEALIKWRENI